MRDFEVITAHEDFDNRSLMLLIYLHDKFLATNNIN